MKTMDNTELLKNRLQDSIDIAEKMNEDLDAVSWGYQEGILLSCNEAKLVIELINKLTIPVVVGQSEQLKTFPMTNVIEAMERVQDLVVRSQPKPKE